MIFRRLVWLALGVALLVGTLQVAVQHWTALPIIHEAESYEAGLYHAAADQAEPGEVSVPQVMAAQGLTERLAWTWVANALMNFALALLVFSALGFYARTVGSTPPRWKLALAIFVTGYVGFFLWPSLGMPPEIPGMDSARLGSRQLWWILSAACAIVACLLMVLTKRRSRWLFAAVLLTAPYFFGPPDIIGDPFARFDLEATLHMRALSRQFIYASAVSSALQWLFIGLACSAAFVRWLLPAMDPQSKQRSF